MNLSIDRVKEVTSTEKPKTRVQITAQKPVLFKFQKEAPADSLVTKKLWSDETKAVVLGTSDELGIEEWKPTLLKTNHDAIKASQTHLIDLLRYYEGDPNYYYEAYTYSYNDNYKNATNGFGNLSSKTTTQEKAYEEMCKDLEKRAKEIKRNLKGTYETLPASIKEGLIDLNYNKGLNKITKNKKLMEALKNGNYAEAISEMKYVHSGKSNKKTKENEDAGLYRRSLSRMILASRDLSGNEALKAEKQIKKCYKEALDCYKRNNKNSEELTKIYEYYTTGKISGKEKSAESFKFHIDKSFKGKGFWSVGQALKKELNITDSVEFKKFYNKLTAMNNNGKGFKTGIEINVPYLKNLTSENAQVSENKEITDTIANPDSTEITTSEKAEEPQKEKKKGIFRTIIDAIGSFFSAIGKFFAGLFGRRGKDETPVENDTPFNKLLNSPDTKIEQDGEFQVITSEYTVQKGDGVWRLAKIYNMNEEQFCADNNIADRDKIQLGQKLTFTKLGYKINKNETIKDAAEKFGLDELLLKDLNNIEDGEEIEEGRILEIPGFIYKVKKGDTLYNISKRTGVSIDKLKSINNLGSNDIYPDQKIKVIYNNVDYAIPESRKKTTIDKETNTVTEVIDMSFDPELKSRTHLKKNKRNGKIIATREVFKPTGSGELSGKTIIVNAGHGYKLSGLEDRGTIGRKYNFPDEWLLNYDNSMRLIEKLRAEGAKVIYLQGNEGKKSQGMSLISNALEERENKADMFISIHVNSSQKSDQKDRMEVFHHPKSQSGKGLASIVDKNMEEYIHQKDKNYKVETKEGDKQVLRTFNNVSKDKTPGILWEVAFLNSKEGRKRLSNSDLMDKYADIMCESVIEYFKQK